MATGVTLETAQNTLDRAKQLSSSFANSQTADNIRTNRMVASGQLPASQLENIPQRTGFSVDIPDSIPSTSLVDGGTFADVRANRAQREADQQIQQQFDTDLNNLNERISTPFGGSVFANPEQFINQLLLNRPTDTQNELDTTRSEQAEGIRDFASELDRTGRRARNEFGITGLQESLAETRNRIADRTKTLRETLRDFETNAERRGVAREFVQSEKAKVQADAAAELADLAIIESAQLGNLEQAQGEIDRVLNEKIQAFQFENMAIEQEIQRLEAINTREADVRSEQLQIALNERERNENKLIQEEKERLGYLSEAAANGADTATLDAIRNAASPSEAALLAGPWIGRLDRLQANASIRSANATAELKERELEILNNPPEPDLVDSETIDILNDLSDGQRDTITTARETVNEIDRMIELVESVDDLSLLSATTEEGREFQQISANVVDKLARERTGAVVGADEEKTFKKIVGVGVFNQIAKDDEELVNGLKKMRQKHSDVLSLNDPTGRIRDYLDANTLGEDDEEVNVLWGVQATGGGNINPANYF